jgi:hypothetical protein
MNYRAPRLTKKFNDHGLDELRADVDGRFFMRRILNGDLASVSSCGMAENRKYSHQFWSHPRNYTGASRCDGASSSLCRAVRWRHGILRVGRNSPTAGSRLSFRPAISLVSAIPTFRLLATGWRSWKGSHSKSLGRWPFSSRITRQCPVLAVHSKLRLSNLACI